MTIYCGVDFTRVNKLFATVTRPMGLSTRQCQTTRKMMSGASILDSKVK